MKRDLTNKTQSINEREWVALAVLITALILVIRLISLAAIPLMDTTEARYGEMARIMAETGNWVTPMFDYNVPFWGKPPLFTWMSATGINLFGLSEFSVRIPHLFVALMTLALVGYLASSETKVKAVSALSVLITATSAVFIVVGGSVMTDTALTFSITLTMLGFWQFSKAESESTNATKWALIFSIGLALGMLSKGPLTLVLVGMSLTAWLTLAGRWSLVRAFPWRKAIGIFLLFTLPWYVMAEMKTPGFLDYFIVGEHFKRFVVSGWQGDLYGNAHKETRGTIWLFWLLAAFPWSPLIIWQTVKGFIHSRINSVGDSAFRTFLWAWMLSPLILFTLAGNVLPSYVMPAIPPMAILIACNIDLESVRTKKNVKYAGVLTCLIISVVAILLSFGLTSKQAEKDLLNIWKQQGNYQDVSLFYLDKRPFSGQYYSQGVAIDVKNLEEIQRPSYVVYETRNHSRYQTNWFTQCREVGQSKKRTLVYCGL